ncbi:Transposable element P transposase [Frankliniella fusca]|uniref:Transposable element P transposase n=1 Tax=Frankliniella fusca TaxID=407009 RepID=A0AAE1LG35_9NEOP|nr:Transposable element P transposase [Frankliniella fusca]
MKTIELRSAERRATWEKLIKRKDTPMTLNSRVCSEHFTVNDLELDYICQGIDGSQNTRGSPPKKPKEIELPPVLPEIAITSDDPPEIPPSKNLEEEEETNNNVSNNSLWSCDKIHSFKIPINWVVGNTIEVGSKVLYHIDPKTEQTKSITFSDQQPKLIIKFRGVKSRKIFEDVNTVEEAQSLLEEIDKIKLCTGTGSEINNFSTACEGMVSSKKAYSDCHCKYNFFPFQVKKYKRRIEHVIRQCQAKDESVLAEAISKLPAAQQEAVKACFSASKRKGPSGRRYTAEWVYGCMLMRIKDKKLYNYIRKHEILVLPATSTINGYLKHYGGAYGFQPQVLDMLQKKTAGMHERFRRGMILIDEMKLTKGAHFDASTLKVIGFKDMGEDAEEAQGDDFLETVEEAIESLPIDPKARQKINRREKSSQKTKNDKDRNLGDYALVISFQPFRGKWVQAIACFLTRGNASDSELTKLVLEAVILLERSGLLVDGVVTDGATWNRSMWAKFGISKETFSAQHPCDPDRKLYFISDFPHMMKCMRNCLCSKKINQFWSASVAAAMECYRFQGVDKLDDCQASIEMCQLINNLADAMNSNRPDNALRLGSTFWEWLASATDHKRYGSQTLQLANATGHNRYRSQALQLPSATARERYGSQALQRESDR